MTCSLSLKRAKTQQSSTLVGFRVPSFRPSIGRKVVAAEKFFFFDVGVANALLGRREIIPHTPSFGRVLEHLVYLEIKAYVASMRSDQTISYWRSQTQLEVGFVVGSEIAIEVKATGTVVSRDLRGLRALMEDTPLQRKIVVSAETHPRTTEDGIEILHYQRFFSELWQGKIL